MFSSILKSRILVAPFVVLKKSCASTKTNVALMSTSIKYWVLTDVKCKQNVYLWKWWKLVKSLESPNSKFLLFYLNVNDSFNLNSFWIATVMERSFITVNGLPAKFISLGDGIEAKPKKIILIIPGKFSI